MTTEAWVSVDSAASEVFTAANDDWSPEIEVTRLICDTYLIENGLAQGDRISMAASVELRSPLVDHVLVETVIGLRKRFDDTALAPKAWLRQSMAERVLPEVRDRPKRGFEPPIKEWVRSLLGKYGEILENGVLVQQGIFQPKQLARLRRFSPVRQRAHMVSFDALVLEQWCQALVDIRAKAARPEFEDFEVEPPRQMALIG
jgi:asparagine synthase (glutamine-hydrolysing)